MGGPKGNQWLQQLVFVGPAFIFFSIIVLIPFFFGIYYSFTSWNGISTTVEWVGWDNFKRLFSDRHFVNAFLFTVKFMIVTVIITNTIAFLLALLLTRALKLRNLYRTVYFLPNVIGGLLLGYIFQFIFTRGFPALGELTGIGLFQLPWLGTAGTGFWAVVIISVWQMAGYMMVIYIAGIISIPKELLEAGKIDGASGWSLIRRIVVPLVMPSVTVCLFLTISNCFKAFDQILSLTGGGPFKSTETVALDIYFEAFTRNHFGLGSAKAIVFFIIVAAVTMVQVALTKRREVEA